jgi:CRP/FNR family cyclic AMP-dependent transcriptional regulator
MHWPILDGLTEEDAERILAAARRRCFEREEVVFHEGDPGDRLHLVESGRFAVRIATQYADEAILTVLGPGEFFGELALLTPGAPRSATISALESGSTLTLHADDFRRLRREHPEVIDVLIAVLATQVRRLSRHLVEALYLPAETRVRRRLLEIAGAYGGDVVPLSQDQVAELAGVSRATTNKVLREDSAKGYVRLARRQTEVLDREALARLAGLR